MMNLSAAIYRFDNVTVDVANARLTVAGETRHLEPKSFRVLQYLLGNPGRVVTKEELFTAVWNDAFVTDNVLTRAIAQLRKALGEDPRQPRFIETVPTLGYRFTGMLTEELPVQAELPVSVPSLLPPIQPRPKRHLVFLGLAGFALVLLAAGLFLLLRPKSSLNTRLSGSTQFSTGSGLDICATFSPDGNLVAYSSDRSGSFQIYVRSLEPAARELTLTSDAGQNLYPRFSPDGRVLAYSALATPGIFRVPALGGTVQRLASFGVRPIWSPDGKWIVFRSNGPPSVATTDQYFFPDSTLWLMNADGSDLHQITGLGAAAGTQAYPSWNADSSEIRFANYTGKLCGMFAYELGSNRVRKLFNADLPTGFGDATFLPDGTAMFYISSRINGDIGIWEQPLNPSTLTPTAPPHPIYQPSIGVPRDLSLSKDGQHLAFSATLTDSRIQMLRFTDKFTESSTPVDLTHEVNYRFTQPRWSGDDKTLAFTSLPKSRPPRLALLSLSEGEVTDLGKDHELQLFPNFADGDPHLFYVAVNQKQRDVSFRQMELPGGLTQILQKLPPSMDQPTLSPDGTTIAFNSRESGVLQIAKMDLRTGETKQLTFGSVPSGYPHFSRDGRRISFERLTDGQSSLVIMPSDGPAPAEDFARGVFYIDSWSPDDSKIAYAGFENGIWNLYWIDLATHQRRQLTRNTNARIYYRYPDWSHDGRKMAFEYNETKGNVYLAELN